jgi:hypothetical protein
MCGQTSPPLNVTDQESRYPAEASLARGPLCLKENAHPLHGAIGGSIGQIGI